MAYVVLTCNGYAAEAEAETLERAIELCRDLEARAEGTADTYARVVRHHGQLVADADGTWSEPGMSLYERQEASFGESP